MNRVPRGSYIRPLAAKRLGQSAIDALVAARERGDIADFRAWPRANGDVTLYVDVGRISLSYRGRGDELVARALAGVRT